MKHINERITTMNRLEMIKKCKELGIKNVCSKTKSELMLLLYNKEVETIENEQKHKTSFLSPLNDVLLELLSVTPKDKTRKVCKTCGEIGHGVTSVKCIANIDKNNKLMQKIKKHVLSQDCLSEKTADEYCIELSLLLGVTPNLCKSLYNEIPNDELLQRKINIVDYLKNTVLSSSKECVECKKTMFYIQKNTHRVWKNTDICDNCWHNHENERIELWKKIKEHKPTQCNICFKIQSNHNERFHYDHKNMFDKENNIFNMVCEGFEFNDIYNELNKCQILCLSCHHIVTDIEQKIGFTRIKQSLTRKLNNNEITEEEHNEQTEKYKHIYEEKIKNIYEELRLFFINK